MKAVILSRTCARRFSARLSYVDPSRDDCKPAVGFCIWLLIAASLIAVVGSLLGGFIFTCYFLRYRSSRGIADGVARTFPISFLGASILYMTVSLRISKWFKWTLNAQKMSGSGEARALGLPLKCCLRGPTVAPIFGIQWRNLELDA